MSRRRVHANQQGPPPASRRAPPKRRRRSTRRSWSCTGWPATAPSRAWSGRVLQRAVGWTDASQAGTRLERRRAGGREGPPDPPRGAQRGAEHEPEGRAGAAEVGLGRQGEEEGPLDLRVHERPGALVRVREGQGDRAGAREPRRHPGHRGARLPARVHRGQRPAVRRLAHARHRAHRSRPEGPAPGQSTRRTCPASPTWRRSATSRSTKPSSNSRRAARSSS